MPKYHKAITGYASVDFEDDLNVISDYFEGKSDKFEAIFTRWKLRVPKVDDLEALIDRVIRRLVDFALMCDAIPLRTRRKLKATVKEIAKRPVAFLANVGAYDPEAVAQVYAAFTKDSPENRLLLSHFEAGLGPPPPAEAISQAAFRVLADLQRQTEEQSHVGGQTLVLQRELIQDLAWIFVDAGGSLKRSTQFDANLPAKFHYRGPFHDFLELVLPPVRPFARKAGFLMERICSLVGIPDRTNRPKRKDQSWLIGKDEERGPENVPARVENFFERHAKRLKRGWVNPSDSHR